MVASPGRLQVISTPIGNIGDLAPRARDALTAADLVLAEDTRHSGLMLASLGLSCPLQSLHEHNEAARVAALVRRMQQGATLALISDAGTPLLSDPGYQLVRACIAAGIEVQAIPGPSAIIAALTVAGLPTDRFVFEGFLPARRAARLAALRQLAGEARTLVLFESPHRIADTLADCAAVLGAERAAVVARELTKRHETVYRGSLGQLLEQARDDADFARGEITLLIGGCAPAAEGDPELLSRALPLLLRELPPARAAAIAARLCGIPREQAYQMALALQKR